MKRAIAIVAAALIAEAGCITLVSPHAGKKRTMKPTIICGMHLTEVLAAYRQAKK